jgi:L-threonylcarbamoyladenylate synthase
MNLVDCTDLLLRSKICVVPTETVYGLACSAFSIAAVKKVYELKGRPTTNPLIVHVLNHDSANKICKTNELSFKLAKAFWPGALTVDPTEKKMHSHGSDIGTKFCRSAIALSPFV